MTAINFTFYRVARKRVVTRPKRLGEINIFFFRTYLYALGSISSGIGLKKKEMCRFVFI